jgi:hypothetical protein
VTQNVTPGQVAAAFDPGRFARQTFALFGGFGTSPAQSAALALLALLPVVAGFASASRGRGVRTVAWLSGGAAILLWLFGTATIGLSERPLGALIHFNGLMITMPLAALAGFGLARAWRDPRCETLRVGILAGGLFLLAMSIGGVAVQDVFGFGVHWGPRMLLPALPAVLAPSLLCLLDAPARQRVPRTVFAALVVASLLASAQATWLLVEQKREGARLEAALDGHPQIYVVTRADYLAQQLAGLWDRKRFLLVETNPALRTVIGGMSARGVRDFLFVVPPDTPDIDWIPGARCAGVHRHRGRRLHYLDYDIQRCELSKES